MNYIKGIRRVYTSKFISVIEKRKAYRIFNETVRPRNLSLRQGEK